MASSRRKYIYMVQFQLIKEEYGHIKLVLDLLKYNEHNWVICVDLKMVNFLIGQQGGYTKYPCFLCLWDCRVRDKLWTEKIWLVRTSMTIGRKEGYKWTTGWHLLGISWSELWKSKSWGFWRTQNLTINKGAKLHNFYDICGEEHGKPLLLLWKTFWEMTRLKITKM